MIIFPKSIILEQTDEIVIRFKAVAIQEPI